MTDSSPPVFRSLSLALIGTVLALGTLVTAFFIVGSPQQAVEEKPAIADGLLTENAIALLEIQNAEDGWKRLRQGLEESDRLLVESIARAYTETWFGPGVSFAEDLLPLLRSPALLLFENGSGGLVTFVITGQADNDLLAATLDRLHGSVRAALSLPEKVIQPLDDTFTSVTMRTSATVKEEEAIKGSWKLRSTFHAERGGLASAIAGNRFVIANDRTLLKKIITASPSMTIPHGVTLEGVVRMTLLRGTLEQEGWSGLETLPLPWNTTGSLLWRVPAVR